MKKRARSASMEPPTTATTSRLSSPKSRRRETEFSESSFTDDDELLNTNILQEEERCTATPAAVSDQSPAESCCSSNGLDRERVTFLDLDEVQSLQGETSTCNCGDESRRETSLSSELDANSQEVESMEKPTTRKVDDCRRIASTATKTKPTELEIEEFFASAEKDILKRFSAKYNYDIVKDVPLEGRYEWVRLNQ